MIRTFNEQYPSLQEKQADFRKALVSMVNARKYLESKGFRDILRGGDPTYRLIEDSILAMLSCLVLVLAERIQNQEYVFEFLRD